MRIFVTGASGFVGGAATRTLVSLGHEVVAMSRSHESDALILELGGKPLRCDLATITPTAMETVDVVIHCAAFVEPWGPKEAWFNSNGTGTQTVLNAAQIAGVKRFIHIGTEAAICHGQDVIDADEQVPLAFNSPYPYCSTKAQAEQLVRDANNENFTTLILRPRFIWGPGDKTLLPLIEDMAKSGKWTWINHGKAMTSTTHIDNLIHAITLSLDKGQGGNSYFILDVGNISLKNMISAMAKSKGLSLADRSIPISVADFMGRSAELVWRTLNLSSSPPLTAHAAIVMSRHCTLVGNKAETDLGYHAILSREQGLESL